MQVGFKNLPLFLGSLVLPLMRNNYLEQCNTPMATWLYVMAFVHFLNALRSIFMVALILRMTRRPKNLRPAINKYFFLTVTLFENLWLIYGNTFIFSDETISCKTAVEKVQPVWIFIMIELALGYITFITTISVVIGVSILYFVTRRNRRQLELDIQNSGLVAKVTYETALKGLRKRRFSRLNHT